VARDNDVFVLRGQKEFVAALKKIEGDLPKEMRKAFRKIADHVVGVAQQRMPYGHGVAVRSLKPRATNTRVFIQYPKGGPEARNDKDGYYPWLDFGGGKAGARGITASSPIAHAKHTGGFKRPVISKGRYLYPAVGESTGFVSDAVDDVLRDMIVKAGFGTSGHA
jgi:hypothetical protein